MGTDTWTIANYEISVDDYFYEEFPKDKLLYLFEFNDTTFFSDLTLKCIITNHNTGESDEVTVSALELFTVKKNKYKGFLPLGLDGPREWLFNRLMEQGKLVKVSPKLSVHFSNSMGMTSDSVPTYYLNSDICDEDIKVSTHKKVFEIKTLAELDWLAPRGFYV